MDDGLVVQLNGAVINLNGHSLTGPGPESQKVGTVLTNSKNITINGPGKIRNFKAGILATESDEIKVNDVTFERNKMALFFTASHGILLVKNIIESNDIGIAAHSSDTINVNDNQISNNRLAGITSVGSSDTTISQNNIDGSANGIFFDPQSRNNIVQNNKLTGNTIDLNNADGIPCIHK